MPVGASGKLPQAPTPGSCNYVVAVPHVIGKLVDFRIVGAGFEEQNRAVRVFAESRGEGATGGTGSDDDEVVGHFVLLKLGLGRGLGNRVYHDIIVAQLSR